MKKISFITLLALFAISFLTTSVSAQTKSSFTDVPSNDSHYESIYTLSDEGIINGYPDKKGKKKFKPSSKLDRSHTAVLFARAMGLKAKNVSAALKKFKDISPKHDYADQIAATYEANIFRGNKGYFYGEDSLTREQMASVLVKAYKLKSNGKHVKVNMKNVDPSHKTNVQILADTGVTTEANNFRPNEAVSRGQFSTFLYRAIQQKTGKYKTLKVSYLNVGQGDSAVLHTPNGKTILIDGGKRSAGNKVVQYLKKNEKSVDLLVATHPDADHIGGLVNVLKEVPVRKVLDSGKTHTTQTYLEMLSLIDQKNIPMTIPKAGDKINIDKDLKVDVLNSTNASSDTNDSSIVLKVTYNNSSYMFTGDATVDNEKNMIANYNVRADVLKAGHHGSKTSTSQAFVNAVKPQIGILSYGKNNYGHPDPSVVNRLVKANATLYSTMKSGNIDVNTNGFVYLVNAKPYKNGDVTKPKPDPKPEHKPNPKPDPGVTYPININKANYDNLQEIIGVGEVIAQRIIDYRKTTKFKKKSDIMNVKGIGPATYEKMKNEITV